MKRTRTFIAAATLVGAIATAPAAHAQPAQATAETGETYYLNEEGTHYVPDPDSVGTPFEQLDRDTREKSVAVEDAAEAGLVEPSEPAEAPLSKGDVDPESPHQVANGLIALPSVFRVEGTTYYLNKDGKTYVADMERIDAEPTAEEIEASNALLAQHGAEAGRQGIAEAEAGAEDPATEAPNVQVTHNAAADPAPRGIGAETGSNAVAQGLAALLVASALGAAVFAYGRRRLI
ncbi:hypothetical protein [Corynebacterium auris]|uniref:hypothetical protein n=1 Tax=Corynebacterium auris TaxID=44750 RepID=UPI0025B2A2DF|nr:hypothetical protein [Corynebacterium auris]WJY68818.1 hypothetical protein CAURIS_09720 [Corynebacterium auris]